MSDVVKLKQQIVSFQQRREELGLKRADEADIAENSDESKVDGLDLDQRTESGFSAQDQNPQDSEFTIGG
jgi:hypothetical protein